jgi:hypothetical protein
MSCNKINLSNRLSLFRKNTWENTNFSLIHSVYDTIRRYEIIFLYLRKLTEAPVRFLL